MGDAVSDDGAIDLGDWLEFNCYENDQLLVTKEFIRGKLNHFTLKNVRTGDSCIIPFNYKQKEKNALNNFDPNGRDLL